MAHLAEVNPGQATFSRAAACLLSALDRKIVNGFFMRDPPIQKVFVDLFLK